MAKPHVFVSVDLESIDDVIGQLEGLRKVMQAAYDADLDPDDPEYVPNINGELESRNYSDGWDLTVTY